MIIRADRKIPYVYIEKGKLYRHNYGVWFSDKDSSVQIPVNKISTIFIGPGVSTTHAAIVLCSKGFCLLSWVGDKISKAYSMTNYEARSSYNTLKQAYLYFNKKDEILKRYISLRLPDLKIKKRDMTEERIRGFEGSLMKKSYLEYAKKYGIPWHGRMKGDEWDQQTVYNRAISIANSCLYGIITSVINTLGYNCAFGILHNGNTLSLTFDLADLFKINFSIKFGFEMAQKYKGDIKVDNI